MERKVIIIAGPTCSGKTKVAIDLAKKLNTEIVSADSRQVYKSVNIGTAKPSLEELEKIRHHFIDYIDPSEDFNVSRFETESIAIFLRLLKAGKIPVVAGGTGLYIKALTDGIFNTVDSDEEYRSLLKGKMIKYGKDFLYDELEKLDPVSASKMLPQNWKRVMRALEVLHLTGKPIWEFQETYRREIDFEFHQYGLLWERQMLYNNIEKRVDRMINSGLVDEIKYLLEQGYSKEINALNTVGYKEIIDYLENNISLERAIELIKRNTRRYAKRQMTWFRKNNKIKWMQINSEEELITVSDLILKDIKFI